MTGSKFIDSSIWISFLLMEKQEVRPVIISNDVLLTSTLSLFEIKAKMLKRGESPKKVTLVLELVKRRSSIVDIDSEIAESAAELSAKDGLHTTDALIYASAMKSRSTLITLDNDFRGMDDVEILD